jgi:hypothetical protein
MYLVKSLTKGRYVSFIIFSGGVSSDIQILNLSIDFGYGIQ